MTEQQLVRPEFCTDEMLEFLDELRESGITNMYGAGPYLEEEFPVTLADPHPRSFRSSEKAGEVLLYWMKTFGKGDR